MKPSGSIESDHKVVVVFWSYFAVLLFILPPLLRLLLFCCLSLCCMFVVLLVFRSFCCLSCLLSLLPFVVCFFVLSLVSCCLSCLSCCFWLSLLPFVVYLLLSPCRLLFAFLFAMDEREFVHTHALLKTNLVFCPWSGGATQYLSSSSCAPRTSGGVCFGWVVG